MSSVRDWLGAPAPVDRDAALAELARRYLVGHGPASDRDLAKWAGLPLRDARAGLSSIAAKIEDAEDGTVRLRGRGGRGASMPAPRLLGAFDPTLVGWASRAEITGPREPRIVSGGIFRPYALVGGRAAGVWRWTDGEVVLEVLEELSGRALRKLEREAAEVKPASLAILNESLIGLQSKGYRVDMTATMSDPDTPVIETLMEIERELAEGDGATYRDRLSDDAVVVVPGRVLDKSSTVEVMEGSPNWDDLSFANRRLRVLDDDAAIVTYRFTGKRGYERYDAVLSSTYVREAEQEQVGARVPPADPAALAATAWIGADGRPGHRPRALQRAPRQRQRRLLGGTRCGDARGPGRGDPEAAGPARPAAQRPGVGRRGPAT